MPVFTRTLSKLRGRSLAELSTRGKQVIASAAERHGLSPELRALDSSTWLRDTLVKGALPAPGPADAESLLHHFRTRSAPWFFASFGDPEATLAELRSRWPGAEAATLERAERIRAGRFDFLGCQDLSFGSRSTGTWIRFSAAALRSSTGAASPF